MHVFIPYFSILSTSYLPGTGETETAVKKAATLEEFAF